MKGEAVDEARPRKGEVFSCWSHQCCHSWASGDQLGMQRGRNSASEVFHAECKVQRSDEKIPPKLDQEAAADKIPAVM